MNTPSVNKNDYLIFAVFSAVWIFLGWIAFLMSLGGFFYAWIIGGFFILMIGVIARQIMLGKMSFRISRGLIVASLVILIFVISASFFATPTIFSGRDQGSISEASIRLSQNHKLEFSTPASSQFFKLYGPGKALNFPGFYYTPEGQLTTQFPLAYISWLAIFYSFFGLAGLIIANAILFFIFFLSFYLLARRFLKEKFAYILLALTATSFPIFWFFKFTLSENMALALLWISILWIYLFIKEQRLFFYSSFLLSAGLLVFTRIEGIFLLISGFLTIFFFTRKNFIWKGKKKFLILYPAIFLAILLIMNFTKNIPFYKEMGKALLHIRQDQSDAPSTTLGFLSPAIFELRVFFLYGLTSSLFLGIFATIYFWVKKKWDLLIPLFVTLPSLVYLFNPWISSDHPWMLRRFAFSIVPVFIFYSILFLQEWSNEEKRRHRKIISWIFIFIMLISNLLLFYQYFPFSENKNLLKETKKISDNFNSNDLVLIDRVASGDGFSMITGPLNFMYNKNAVYFFNPKDAEKIDKSKFKKIYLLTSNQSLEFFVQAFEKDNLIYIKDYSIKNEKLSSSDLFLLPEKEAYEIKGKIFEVK